MSGPLAWLEPDWPVPPGVLVISTLRSGGASAGPFASLNLAAHVGDRPEAVAENRRRLRVAVGPRHGRPKWRHVAFPPPHHDEQSTALARPPTRRRPFLLYEWIIDPNALYGIGLKNTSSVIYMLAMYVLALVIYLGFRSYRKREGIDIDKVYQEIPVE